MTSAAASGGFLSVVVPAHRCASDLSRCLQALRASDLGADAWELIVVDDASGDDTAAAAAAADRVLEVAGGVPRGPAHARNRGAAAARGDVLAFVDADVLVHPGTLRGLVSALAEDAAVAAAFGAYDDDPAAAGFVSTYRNLVHHYVHARGAGYAETFWAGCGVVRRSAFEAAGGFDERRYRTPQIEDIELGYRLRDLGGRILLRPELQAKHLKRWSLGGMMLTDVRDRGAPWVELLLERRSAAPAARRRLTLNAGALERALTALAGAGAVGVVLAAGSGDPGWLWVPAAAAVLIALGEVPLLRWLARRRGSAFAAAAVPLRWLHYGLNAVSVVLGLWRHVRGGASRRLGHPPDGRRRASLRPPAGGEGHGSFGR